MRRALLAVLSLLLAACQTHGGAVPSSGFDATGQPQRIPYDAYVEWPAYAHDFLRSGTQANPAVGITPATVKNLRLRWVFHPPDAEFVGQPISAGGTLYVGSRKGWIYALDAVTGALKWSRHIPNPKHPVDFYMTPLFQAGLVYLGSHNQNGILVALDAFTGKVVWQRTLPGSLRGAPIIINGLLYVGVGLGDPPWCKPGGIYVFNAATGEPGPDWLTAVSTQADGGGVWGPISFDGSNMFFGTGNSCTTNQGQANSIVAMSLSLSLTWLVQTASSFEDRDVASGMTVRGLRIYGIGKNGIFYAIDRRTGRIIWSVLLNPHPRKGGFSTPTVVGDTILISNGFNPSLDPHKGRLLGLTTSGHIKWQLNTMRDIKGSESIAGGVAFVGLDNSIAAIDPETGAILWRRATPGLFYDASPAITPDGVFTADSAGYVYAFGLTPGPSRAAASLPRAWLGMPVHEIPPPKYCKLY